MTTQNAPILNVFTVDVEDYFQVGSFADRIDPQTWDQYESRVVANTRRTLRLLEDHGVRGTFFILGWVADRFPDLVREIHDAGHELGCHSFWHQLIYKMTPDEFREDLLMACKAVEETTGERVVTFRAPSFSITEKSLWALDILIEEGFKFDSSIFPVYHDTYGIPGAERFPHRIGKNGSSLWEFPPTVHQIGRFNIPVAGGGYFRLYPARLSIHWLRRINQQNKQPFVFYIHPWELDPDQPRLAAKLKSRFRHYQNLGSTERKLNRLLKAFQFTTMSEAIAASAKANSDSVTSPADLQRIPLSNS